GYFCGTGMHGGSIYVGGEIKREKFPRQVRICEANADDLAKIEPYMEKYVTLFNKQIPTTARRSGCLPRIPTTPTVSFTLPTDPR
ncbi:MAG TPA: hypothetical protein PLR57_04870, partial [Clostridia bacterium]|nr:hypothetical protein [Clostridia bacterium]